MDRSFPKSRLFSILVTPILFFLIASLTLPSYGISWDEPIHFYRGQAYLNYMLTGEVRFRENETFSYYQNNNLPAEYWLKKDDGHPPLNGILASVFNLIFYQKLGIIGDIESYHLFNIVVSTILVAIVVLFAYETYGVFASIIAGLSVASYPLFFSEAHFNIKDPSEAAFFTLTIWSFWKSLERGSWKWLLASIIGFSFALGTKFNILFLPFIIVPYLFIRYKFYIGRGWNSLRKALCKIPKKFIFVLLASPLLVIAIFFGSWPFLLEDPLSNLLFTIRWYQDIGTGMATYGYFLDNGLNLYAPIWILFTTPPWILFLGIIGFIAAIKKRREHNWAPLLWLIWFIVPIARVVVPNTTIYGGVRQIMEFLPAMALLVGLGGISIAQWLNSYIAKLKNSFSHLVIKLLPFLIMLGFIPHLLVMAKLHPNQNVYFNFLIGGLSGAKEKNVPYWGNSFGNAYWQAIEWLNNNSPPGSKLALIQGTTLNIPRIQLRDDLRFSNSYWSGIYRDGEYLIELTYNDKKFYPYAWEYVEKFLEPVYEVKVNGVAIAKVWKNDLSNTKSEFKKNEVIFKDPLVKHTGDRKVVLDIGRSVFLTRAIILYPEEDCHKIEAEVSTSTNSLDWFYEKETIPTEQITYREKESSRFEPFFFPGREVRFIKFETRDSNSCLLVDKTDFKLYVLED